MDEADRASQHWDFFMTSTVKYAGRKSAAPSNLGCEECGEIIPEARRRAAPGCIRCVACQMEYEELGI